MLRRVDRGKVEFVRDWKPAFIGRCRIEPNVLVPDEQERLGTRPRDPLSADMLEIQLGFLGETVWPSLLSEPVPVEVPETIDKLARQVPLATYLPRLWGGSEWKDV